MKQTIERDRAYIAPTSLILPFQTEQVLCESPLPGGNEGIGFEPWN
jgi:hypothetical protein